MKLLPVHKLKKMLMILAVTFGFWSGVIVAAKKEAVSNQKSAVEGQDANHSDSVGPMDQPLIKVNDTLITSRLFATFLQSNPSIVAEAASSEIGKAKALKEMVSVYLLQKTMIDEGLLKKDNKAPTNKEIIEGYEELAKKHFPIPAAPSEEEAYQFYLKHDQDYGIPASIRLSEILVKLPEGSSKDLEEKAKEKIEGYLKQLNSGRDFTELAVTVTENPIASVTKGDIGFVDPDEVSWRQQAVEKISVGGITGIIRSPEGFVILKVTASNPKIITPYPNVRDAVIKKFRDEGQSKLREKFVSEIAKKAKIEIIIPEIQQLFPNGVFQ